MEELKQGRAVSDKTAAALALAHADKEITCAHPAPTASYSHPVWTISEPSTPRGALRTPLKAGYPPVQPVVPGHGPRAQLARRGQAQCSQFIGIRPGTC